MYRDYLVKIATKKQLWKNTTLKERIVAYLKAAQVKIVNVTKNIKKYFS